MSNKLVITTIIIAIAAIAIVFAYNRTSKNLVALTVSIFSTKESFNRSEDVVIQVLIKNPSNQIIQLLKWHTPLDDIERPLFVVTINGNPVPYTGKLIKRAAPTEQDYIDFKPGEQITMSVVLSDIYDLSIPGEYEVIYETASFHLYDFKINDHPEEYLLRSEAITIIVK